jgi:ligand-binding sensor domain-containing protein
MILIILKYSSPFTSAQSIKFDQISIRQGLSNNRVEVVYQDSKGFMWFGTQAGLNRFDGYNVISVGQIYFFGQAKMYEDHFGQLWILNGTPGPLFRYDRITENTFLYKSVGNRAMKVFEDSKGSIWIATLENGIAKYNRESDSFIIYKNASITDNILPDNNISSILEDTEGNLWACGFKGLSKYNKNEGKFILWSSKLTSTIHSIIEDEENFLWLVQVMVYAGLIHQENILNALEIFREKMISGIYTRTEKNGSGQGIAAIFLCLISLTGNSETFLLLLLIRLV